jgi:hypothetical protein
MCDPPARQRLRRGDQPPSKTTLVRSTFESCRAQAIEGHSGHGPGAAVVAASAPYPRSMQMCRS